MSRRDWQPVLDAEVKRLSAMSWEQLAALAGECYEVEFDSKKYQVEVDILENTGNYINVAVSVDDGTLPASIVPLSANFVLDKR